MHRYIESRPPLRFLIAAGGVRNFRGGVQPPTPPTNTALLTSRVSSGSMGYGSIGQMGQFLDGSYGSSVDALSPMTHLHIYLKHVVKATFVVGDN